MKRIFNTLCVLAAICFAALMLWGKRIEAASETLYFGMVVFTSIVSAAEYLSRKRSRR